MEDTKDVNISSTDKYYHSIAIIKGLHPDSGSKHL